MQSLYVACTRCIACQQFTYLREVRVRVTNEIPTKNQTKHKLPTAFNEKGTDIIDGINIANKCHTFSYKSRSENCK